MDPAAADEWIRRHVEPAAPFELVSEEPWATVLRVRHRNGVAWFKACGPVQAFEPRLSASLFARWPDRVGEVLAHDEERSWLLLADAGTNVAAFGNPPEAWLTALPPHAELQRGEIRHAHDHIDHGVPDLRLALLPDRYEDFVRHELPLSAEDVRTLQAFVPRYAELCAELAAAGIPDTVQHDDLHMTNLYVQGDRLRVLDWGDSSISHPFLTLFETFRFLEELTGLPPGDPWFARLRDAYLEPWGGGLVDVFELALRVAAFAHSIAWLLQRNHLTPERRREFDLGFPLVLRRAVAATRE